MELNGLKKAVRKQGARMMLRLKWRNKESEREIGVRGAGRQEARQVTLIF